MLFGQQLDLNVRPVSSYAFSALLLLIGLIVSYCGRHALQIYTFCTYCKFPPNI